MMASTESVPGCPECGFNSCMCDGSPNNPDLDYPAGAIENGREFLRRLGEYDCAAGRICAVPKLRVEAKAYRNAARMVDEQAHSSYRSAALQALGERG